MKWLLNPSSCPGFKKFELVDRIEKGDQVYQTEILHVKIPERYALVNITDQVEEIVDNAKVIDGFAYVGAMHITAGIYINDAESGLLQDISKWIEKLAPFGEAYLHHQTGEDNGDDHLKSYLTNHQIMVPITKGRLHFGTWQQIFYAEFDGLRDKKILVKIQGLSKK